MKDALPPDELAVDVTVATPGAADTALTDVPSGIARAALEIVTVTAAPGAMDDDDGEASSAGNDGPEMDKPLSVAA
jgi:hypothetical protein